MITRCGECGRGFRQPDPSEVYGRAANGWVAPLYGAAYTSRWRRLLADYYKECNEHSCIPAPESGAMARGVR